MKPETIKIDEVEYVRKDSVKAQIVSVESPYTIGANYFIRTATMALTGELVAVTAGELVLWRAAWIADTGRFTQALSASSFAEVEMFPDGKRVIVGRPMVVDAVEIESLPDKQK